MIQKKQLLQFVLENKTDCGFDVSLFQLNVFSVNATTKYSWDITTANLSCGYATIVINGTLYNITFDGTLSGLLLAINALSFGFFCSETIGANTFVYTYDDTNVYGDLDICAIPTTTTTTSTSTTSTSTSTTSTTSTSTSTTSTSTSTTSTTSTSTSTTTSTTTLAPTTTSTTTSTTTLDPTTTTTSTTSTTTTDVPTTSTTTSTTTLEPTTTSTTTSTTTLEPTTTSTTTSTTTLEPTTTSTTTSTTTLEPTTTSTTTTTTAAPTTTTTSTTTTTTTFNCDTDCRNWEYLGASIPIEGDTITYYSCIDGTTQSISLSNGDPTASFCNCNTIGNPTSLNGTTLTEIGICVSTTTSTTTFPS